MPLNLQLVTCKPVTRKSPTYGKYLNFNKSNFNLGRTKIGKNRKTINAA